MTKQKREPPQSMRMFMFRACFKTTRIPSVSKTSGINKPAPVFASLALAMTVGLANVALEPLLQGEVSRRDGGVS